MMLRKIGTIGPLCNFLSCLFVLPFRVDRVEITLSTLKVFSESPDLEELLSIENTGVRTYVSLVFE